MRLGVSTSFTTESANAWIEKHVENGCRTVVFPLNCEDSEDKINDFVSIASQEDVTIAEVGIWRNVLARDEAEKLASLKYAIGQLQLADRIGARCCVNVAGTPHGPRWDGGYKENFDIATRQSIIKSIQTIIDEVNPKNTKFTIEPMPWMVPTGPDDYLRLIDEVERDAFGVHLDIVNMVTSPDRYFGLDDFMEECFEKLGDKICSCHLKDIKLLEDYTFQLRECGCGEGILDIVHYATLADAYDVDMPMIIEHLSSDDAYVKSMKYVRGIIENGK